ncbi:aldehyde dehydrogenase [Subtercola sp. Z020]|uniref:aldehyde dehydrogenase family protein n=1 Tax=Subtercola sp. Z020 TaxID=2080582 RepID=UPI000CE929B8|nr:aldehyde dehydrogenase family protein [Subtercola sp. Z020]PPF87832.1 aldehyde dehydrogenase [Subtercola sp. Z020]
MTEPAPETLTITDPRDGRPVGVVEVATNEQIALAAAAAKRAFAGWSRTAPAERGLALRRAAGLLAEGREQVAELNTRETGKPLAEALGGVDAAVDTLLQYSELAPVHRGRSLNGPRTAVDYTVAEPRGVIAVVTPWNDPVAVACGLIGAALATGNTVVHKPSERCPHVGLLLGELLAPAFPDGVLATISGEGGVGARLLAQPETAAVAHVGSSEAGARIARAAALTGIHVIRENGGNDALIVDEGVDPEWAAGQAALGAFANAGQICTSVERIFVHAGISGAFIQSLVDQARELNGSGRLAPLVDERMRAAVAEQVEESVAEGARILEGGVLPEGPGSFYPATVLVDCEPFMPLMSRETFGPVAPVRVVRSFDEALRLAADDDYGLAATVLTASMEHAHRATAELPVGTVKVNAVFGGAPGGSAEPRAGSGSGFGYGPELLDEMTLVKVVHLGLPVLPAMPELASVPVLPAPDDAGAPA